MLLALQTSHLLQHVGLVQLQAFEFVTYLINQLDPTKLVPMPFGEAGESARLGDAVRLALRVGLEHIADEMAINSAEHDEVWKHGLLGSVTLVTNAEGPILARFVTKPADHVVALVQFLR